MIRSYYRTWGQERINPGDLIVEMGVRHLLTTHFQTTLEDCHPLFIVGTPWFWDQCERSDKYRWLADRLTNSYAHRPLVAMGVGLNVPLGHTHRLLNEATRRRCREMWSKFALLIVRDPEAAAFLTSIDVRHTLLPCPSIFAWQGDEPARPGSALVIDAPVWNETLKPAKLPHLAAEYWRYDGGTYHPADIDAMLRFLAAHETIVSARVHCAVPMVAHRRVAVVPMDSRVLTARHVGIPEYPEFSDPAAGRALRAWAETEYVALLGPVLGAAAPPKRAPAKRCCG